MLGLITIALLAQTPQPRLFMQPNLPHRTAVTCAVPPCPPMAGLVLWVDGTNLDGQRNSTVSNSAALGTWKNLASAQDFTQSSSDLKPHARKLSTENAAALDGIQDEMTASGTKSTLRFVHETGLFDLVLVLRRKGTCIQNEKRLIGSAEGEKGLFVALNCPNNTTGSLWVILGNGTDSVSSSRYPLRTTPLGVPTKVLVRGTGTSMKVSNDFATFTTQPFDAFPFGTGDSLYDWSLGACSPAEDLYNVFDGDLFQVLLWNRNLSASELTQLQAFLVDRVGSGI